MSFKDILRSIAPALTTVLFGPAAGAAVEFLSDKLGTDKTIEAVTQRLSGLSGTDLIKLKELDLDFQKFMSDNGVKIDLAQIELNKTEAVSESWFISGWRPAVGWIGAASLFYISIAHPIFMVVSVVAFGYKGQFPTIDTSISMQVLFGILGLGAMRSFDKFKGTTNGH
jgi:hypothetical protein